MSGQQGIDHGPFAERRSKILIAEKLSSQEKTWLGTQITEGITQPLVLAERYSLSKNTLKHWAKVVRAGKVPQESGGAPRKINDDQLELLKNEIDRTMSKSKGKIKKTVKTTGCRINTVTPEAYHKLTHSAMSKTSIDRGAAPTAVQLSTSSVFRYNKLMDVSTTTSACVKTTAAIREMGHGRNHFCDATVLEAFAKPLSPHVRLNGDALTFAMGKVTTSKFFPLSNGRFTHICCLFFYYRTG
jgi:hypothetical protein